MKVSKASLGMYNMKVSKASLGMYNTGCLKKKYPL
jgi:hypothetical protein